jgi:hypothetical protein
MNKITVHIQMERIGGNIPQQKIDEILDRLSFLMVVSDVSFESDWIPDVSRITYKGKLKRDI